MSSRMMYIQPPYGTTTFQLTRLWLPNDVRCPTIALVYFKNDGNRPPIGWKMRADVQPCDVQSTTILHSHALVYLTNDGNRPPIVVHYTNICQIVFHSPHLNEKVLFYQKRRNPK